VAAAPLALCAEFLPSLRGYPESLIVNVSSPAAYQPVPYMASYAAAKTALQHFSLALYQELKGTGVLVQTLVPAPSQTEFDDRAGAYQSGVGDVRRPPEEVVAACLANLDTERPLAGNAKGLYKQRMFAGLFPVRMVLAMVAKMFKPPAGRLNFNFHPPGGGMSQAEIRSVSACFLALPPAMRERGGRSRLVCPCLPAVQPSLSSSACASLRSGNMVLSRNRGCRISRALALSPALARPAARR
jgi:hypothetical protein